MQLVLQGKEPGTLITFVTIEKSQCKYLEKNLMDF